MHAKMKLVYRRWNLDERSGNNWTLERPIHRVDRVLGFFSSRSNWNSPIPSPASEFDSGGRDTIACGRVDGGSQFRRGDRYCGTLYMHIHLQGFLSTDFQRFFYRRFGPLSLLTGLGREQESPAGDEEQQLLSTQIRALEEAKSLCKLKYKLFAKQTLRCSCF